MWSCNRHLAWVGVCCGVSAAGRNVSAGPRARATLCVGPRQLSGGRYGNPGGVGAHGPRQSLRVQLAGGFGGQRSCLGRRGFQGGARHWGIPAPDSLNGVAAVVLWAGVELSSSGGQAGQVAAPLGGPPAPLWGPTRPRWPPHTSPPALPSCPTSAPASRYRAAGHSLLSDARQPLPRPASPALPDPSRQPPGSSFTWDGLAGGETPGKQPPPAPGRCPRDEAVT